MNCNIKYTYNIGKKIGTPQRNMQSLMSGPTFLQDVVAGRMIYYYFRNKSFASYRQLSLLRGFLNKILGHIVGCFYLAAQPC